MRTQSATTTITRVVTVAAGVFAPGHLGELTQYLPFETGTRGLIGAAIGSAADRDEAGLARRMLHL